MVTLIILFLNFYIQVRIYGHCCCFDLLVVLKCRRKGDNLVQATFVTGESLKMDAVNRLQRRTLGPFFLHSGLVCKDSRVTLRLCAGTRVVVTLLEQAL